MDFNFATDDQVSCTVYIEPGKALTVVLHSQVKSQWALQAAVCFFDDFFVNVRAEDQSKPRKGFYPVSLSEKENGFIR